MQRKRHKKKPKQRQRRRQNEGRTRTRTVRHVRMPNRVWYAFPRERATMRVKETRPNVVIERHMSQIEYAIDGGFVYGTPFT